MIMNKLCLFAILLMMKELQYVRWEGGCTDTGEALVLFWCRFEMDGCLVGVIDNMNQNMFQISTEFPTNSVNS